VKSYAVTRQRPPEKRAFDPRDVHHQDPARHRGEQWPYRLSKRRRFGEIGVADPVYEDRLLWDGSGRPAQSVQRSTGDHSAVIDRYRGERDDLVASWIEPAEFEVHDAVARLAPQRLARIHACSSVQFRLRRRR